MRRHLLLCCLPLVACTAHHPSPQKILPLARVRLYETGVGYFERAGQLTAKDHIQLPVPAGHLDDALKTLTVIDGGGKILLRGLSFPSSMSRGMALALAGLPLGKSDQVRFRALLAGLKGHTVELQTIQGELRGQLLEVIGPGAAGAIHEETAAGEREDRDDNTQAKAPPASEGTVLLMTAEGSIRRLPLHQVSQVRPGDPELEARLRSAFQALSRASGSRRALRLLADSEGPVTLGYIAEAPLWRCSYRLVSSPGAPATLQGWALVHNDSDEAWRNVQLELVSGRPDSFLYPLAVPRYQRRQLVHPDRALPTVPQLLTTTTDELWGDQLDEVYEVYGAGGLGLSGSGYGGGGTGEGTIGLGTLGTIGKGGGGGEASGELQVGNLASFAPAAGAESGALFSYRLPQGINVEAHSSTLIPFLQEGITAERVTLLRELGQPARSALIFRNATGQTLPAGTVSFFADGGFAGESILPRTKPDERHFLEFGTDLDLELTRHQNKEPAARPRDEIKKVVYRDGELYEHFLRHQTVALALTNRSAQPRRVLLQLQLNQNAKIEGADALDFDLETGRPLAIFAVPAGTTLERRLQTVEGLYLHTGWHGLTEKRLQELAALETLPQDQRAVFSASLARKKKLNAALDLLQKDQAETKRVEAELERLRKHLTAAGDKGGAGAPLVRRILATEDRYRALEQALVRQKEAIAELELQLQRELARLS